MDSDDDLQDFEPDNVRAQHYALLARLLSGPPDDELLDALRDSAVGEIDELDPLAGPWCRLAAAAAETEVRTAERDYHRLFIGVTRGELMPYLSWYLTGFLMEKPLAKLRADLRQIGIERREAGGDPEDHVAALMEVMFLLAEADAPEERDFFAAYIAPWVGRFFADLEAAGAVLYSAVGALGLAFLALEAQRYDLPLNLAPPPHGNSGGDG